jgi:hypothetical protein
MLKISFVKQHFQLLVVVVLIQGIQILLVKDSQRVVGVNLEEDVGDLDCLKNQPVVLFVLLSRLNVLKKKYDVDICLYIH